MRIFCSICKRHVDFDPSDREALKKFRALEHSDEKVARLKRGPVGVYARAS